MRSVITMTSARKEIPAKIELGRGGWEAAEGCGGDEKDAASGAPGKTRAGALGDDGGSNSARDAWLANERPGSCDSRTRELSLLACIRET